MACPKDNKPACPKSILYATEKIIKTPILENNVRANEVVNIFGRNIRNNNKIENNKNFKLIFLYISFSK